MEQQTHHSGDAPKRRPASSGAQHRRPASSDTQHRRPASSGAPKRRPASSDAQHRRPASPDAQHRRPASPDARHRRPASPDAQHRRPASSGAQHRRPASSGAQHRRPPQHRHPAAGSQARRPAQRPAGSRPVRSSAAGARRPASAGTVRRQSRRAPVTRLSLLMFFVSVVLYIIIVSVVVGKVRKKANDYLAEYEESRPQYKIAEYVSTLSDAFFDDMLRQSVLHMPVSDYETTEGLMDTLQMRSASADAAQPYSYMKKEDYTDSRPSYYIMRGEEAVASVVLDRSGWTDRFNFPVWRVNEPVSVLAVQAEPAYEISVTMPQGCTLNVNGNPVPEDIMTEADSDLQLNTMELLYMNQPTAKHCEMSGFYMPPTVEVKDRDGNRMTPEAEPDLTTAHHEYVFRQAAEREPDPALKERVEALTRAYMDYVINKNKDRFNNLAVLNNYLMPGSEAAVLMQTIINDIYWNNEYDGRSDDVRVDGIRVYSEKLCTADVHFDTTLTKSGVGTNEYISTIRWTLVSNGWGWYATSFELHMDDPSVT